MLNFLFHSLERVLAVLAQKVLAKYNPIIIGVTGSHGKTSTRQAIFCVVKEHFRSYTPVKNLNTLIGLPLGILMSDSPGRNILGWVVVFGRALSLIIFKHRYPEVLVLEYGIDRPGEMEKLTTIARPNVAVLTGIGISHLEFFKDQDQLAEEKGKLLGAVSEGGSLVINAEDKMAMRQMSVYFSHHQSSGIKHFTYGGYVGSEVSVRADDISQDFEKFTTDMFLVTPRGIVSVGVSALGETHVKAATAAVAVAESLKLPFDIIKKGLGNYRPQPGRLNIIAGARKSVIIDDTYNASPASTEAALGLLASFLRTNKEKIAVLGSMLELGEVEAEEHKRIGFMAAKIAGRVIAVGRLAEYIAQGAREAGLEVACVESFTNSVEAAPRVFGLLKNEVIVLVKGSQGERMERIVKEIMAYPMRASDLLCRQDSRWLKK